ncbi:MAG TPA: DUF3606 domain-containing protein [Vineibacter sp.]|nr:DUF3606 domain-containing protein [Vineibacter sp.]
MTNQANKPSSDENLRIDISQDEQVDDWCRKLGYSREQLKAAVAAVGPNSNDVVAYLLKSSDRTKP